MTESAGLTLSARPAPSPGNGLLRRVRDHGVYLAIGVLLVFNLVFTPNFATVGNLRLQLVQVVPIAIVALGMALVVATEGIDLSVGSVMAITAAIIPLYLGYGPWLAVAAGLAAGAVVGALNGTLVAFCGVQPIIATLGVLVAGRAAALVLADGRLVEIFDPTLQTLGNGSLLGVPVTLVILAVLSTLVVVTVRWSVVGRRLVAIGGNRAAARLAGLPVRRTLLTVYVVSGALAALAGVLNTARLGASDPSFVGLLIELSAITAVVVGGTPLSGGRIRVVGTLLGALLMQLIAATVIQHDLPDSLARMIQAGIIVVAVYVQRDRGGA
ncbi:ABC transporter permease [Cryptosporangium arvum]|uniref:Monosaccharide ABC transporter membrane protein, CUT2 family n=1 Tax=Cryptosporangium arvum DSM 44712 TaxID=927661 RepID=A0A010YK46_9ACTN|nr:ABC transporter permease [Cryptosporangium arvum]EXG80610.1 monosaccharide ABC transporter membrane protein, CUT2 family [Cryptosporangium arvum DSM 44712]